MEKSKTMLEEGHKHSSNHREEILGSEICGCFHCKTVFNPSEIEIWVDQDENNQGQTALCPRCAIDSVIGVKSGFPVNEKEFLEEMHKRWFDRTVRL
jgi:hypothetical protein